MNSVLPPSPRLLSVDALRGVVILIMLLDHVREFFYLHKQVADPMNIATTEPVLFFARLAAHICPTVFIFLSGISAYLYAQRYALERLDLSFYLLKRGFFLIILEVLIINFAWTFTFPPNKIYLQVIWAIGLSMIALAGLIWLTRWWLIIIATIILLAHNLLAPIQFSAESWQYIPWAILHDRSLIILSDNIVARTSYPVLPWIGVMALGYVCGPCIQVNKPWKEERRCLFMMAVFALTAFMTLRFTNFYGEFHPWNAQETMLKTIMSFLNITKYPPSLHYLLLTGGAGILIYLFLRWLELKQSRFITPLVTFGRASMFFYVIHLYLLHILYLLAFYVIGPNVGDRFGFETFGSNLWMSIIVAIPLFFACKYFADFKKNHPNSWTSYI